MEVGLHSVGSKPQSGAQDRFPAQGWNIDVFGFVRS
jgi:hypothetical protein